MQKELWKEKIDQVADKLLTLREKKKVKDVLRSLLSQRDEEVRKDEKLAWLNGERCYTCGKQIKADRLTDTCGDCKGQLNPLP